MTSYPFLHFLIQHNVLIIHVLMVLIVLGALILVLFSLFGSSSNFESKNQLDDNQIETLKQSIEKMMKVNRLEASDSNLGEGIVQEEVEVFKKKLSDKEEQIQLLKTQLESQKQNLQVSQSQENEVKVNELQAKVKILEGKLVEYEVIEDDIADLSKLKAENQELRNKLKEMENAIGVVDHPDQFSVDEAELLDKDRDTDRDKEVDGDKDFPPDDGGVIDEFEATESEAETTLDPIAENKESDSSSSDQKDDVEYVNDDVMLEFASAIGDQIVPIQQDKSENISDDVLDKNLTEDEKNEKDEDNDQVESVDQNDELLKEMASLATEKSIESVDLSKDKDVGIESGEDTNQSGFESSEQEEESNVPLEKSGSLESLENNQTKKDDFVDDAIGDQYDKVMSSLATQTEGDVLSENDSNQSLDLVSQTENEVEKEIETEQDDLDLMSLSAEEVRKTEGREGTKKNFAGEIVIDGITDDIIAEFAASDEELEDGENSTKDFIEEMANEYDRRHGIEVQSSEESTIFDDGLNLDKMMEEMDDLENISMDSTNDEINSLEEQVDTDKLLSEAKNMKGS